MYQLSPIGDHNCSATDNRDLWALIPKVLTHILTMRECGLIDGKETPYTCEVKHIFIYSLD